MKHVPVAAFKDKVSEFLSEAQAGEEVIITRHGKPTAKLVPIVQAPEDRTAAKTEALARMAQIREQLRAKGMPASIEEMIAWKNEGRP